MDIDLKKAEATGKIKTAMDKFEEEINPLDEVDVDTTKTFDNPNEFELAIGRAQMEGISHLTVSERLMRYILKNKKDKSVTYQGVRCYVEGAKEEMDIEENMSAEKRHDHLAMKKRNG